MLKDETFEQKQRYCRRVLQYMAQQVIMDQILHVFNPLHFHLDLLAPEPPLLPV